MKSLAGLLQTIPIVPRLALLFTVTLPLARAAGVVEPIPAAWESADGPKLAIEKAEATSSLGDQYAPGRICDGDRHTKWVSPIRPSAAAPQWITLTLANGPRAVTGVAVFGERLDNDGIIDADIQVETGGEFRTVAAIRGAPSASWRVAFDPAPTDEVRLVVLQSGGPTDHTDVYEMEVFGKPLSAAEMQARLPQSRDRLRQVAAACAASLTKATAPHGALPVAVRRVWDRVTNALESLDRAPTGPAPLAGETLARTLNETEAALALGSRLQERLERRATFTKQTGVWQETNRFGGDLPGAAGKTVPQVAPDYVALANGALAVWFAGKSGRWFAQWAGDTRTALGGAEFGVEINGTSYAATPAPADVHPFTDPLGSGQALVQVWRQAGVRIERELRLYDGQSVLSLAGRIVNEHATEDVRLGTVQLLRLADPGGWQLGSTWEAPAAVFLQGHSLLRSKPFAPAGDLDPTPIHEYRSSGVLALTSREPAATLVVGYVRADEAAPDLAATFRVDVGGTALSAASRFLGRVLGAGERIELNQVYLAASADAFGALEAYGSAMARCSPRPARTGPTALWCSWYAHRMGMTEEKVLANAAVAARHFQPLGLEIMQLDHGWQRGDITGDWVPNERFPHGLRWLANELKHRHGLRLGVWISPTDVAETSALYREHPDWMLRGPDGKPRVNWRWYWTPNPNCYELDATQPGAYREIVDTFRRLTSEGVSYYKIDFIASSGGEHFIQQDPRATRGWSVLKRSMDAIREGAGEAAWIRYCQTPPILGVGLANSTIGGDDTLDAGIPGRFDVLRDNAQALAAGWWLNDRPYHREVCDMSVRMQGSVEEVRVRAALMTLANCSISWSDELCFLPPSRIRLMQQCMPPGNPPLRPLDLFERPVASVWHLKMTNRFEAWDVVGLFNFEPDPAPRTVRFADLGLDPAGEYAVFEFWESRFLGVRRDEISVELPGESSRILSIRRLRGHPQLIGTDLHLLQGWHEIEELGWDRDAGVLSGVFARVPGIAGRAFFLVPAGYSPKFEFPLTPASARLTHVAGPLWMQEFEFVERRYSWKIPFAVPPAPQRQEPTGTGPGT